MEQREREVRPSGEAIAPPDLVEAELVDKRSES